MRLRLFLRLDPCASTIAPYEPVDQTNDCRDIAADHREMCFDLTPGSEVAYVPGHIGRVFEGQDRCQAVDAAGCYDESK